jgi:hypothetical protein
VNVPQLHYWNADAADAVHGDSERVADERDGGQVAAAES